MNRRKQDDQNLQTRDNHGKFIKGSSGNPKGRPANSEAIRQLLEPRKEELVAKAISLALDGDTTALKLCLDRISSPLKQELSHVSIAGFDYTTGPLEKAELIFNAVSEGCISIEAAEMLLSALVTYSKIYEVIELEKRIEKLESGIK